MEEFDVELWEPKTSLGRKVKEGEITSISQILRSGKRPLEPEIIDALVPNLKEEILGVNLVQRMHRSGRRTKFRVTAVVGNGNGIVGVAHASSSGIGLAVRKAITAAKMSVIEIARGCGSWECRCGRPHSLPFEVVGKKGGVSIRLIPAPRGLGLAAAEVPKIILRQAGVKDVWTQARGNTRTTVNFALATFDALKQTVRMATREPYSKHIVIGEIGEESD